MCASVLTMDSEHEHTAVQYSVQHARWYACPYSMRVGMHVQVYIYIQVCTKP